MKKRKPLTDAEGEVRELTVEDFKQFKPKDFYMNGEAVQIIQAAGRMDLPVVDLSAAGETETQRRVNEALRKARVG